jgi:hypothetical protein
MIRESKGSAEIPASGSEVCIESREGNPESMMPILEGVDFAFALLNFEAFRFPFCFIEIPRDGIH